MVDEAPKGAPTNLELLQEHLKAGSLAARLVDAYSKGDEGQKRSESVRAILDERLAELGLHDCTPGR
jgi:hypothetical protein